MPPLLQNYFMSDTLIFYLIKFIEGDRHNHPPLYTGMAGWWLAYYPLYIAPLLYIVFIDDIVDFFRKRGRYISITTATTIATLLFADDLALPTGINDTGTQQLLDDLIMTFAFMLLLHAFVLTLLKQSSWMPLFHLLPRSLLPPPSSYLLLPVPPPHPQRGVGGWWLVRETRLTVTTDRYTCM
jgi:hypothetical protein